MRNTLNAGATLDRVRVGKEASHYWVHKDLYKTLARIRARSLEVVSAPPGMAARKEAAVGRLNLGSELLVSRSVWLGR